MTVAQERVFLDECTGETQLLQAHTNTLAQTQVKEIIVQSEHSCCNNLIVCLMWALTLVTSDLVNMTHASQTSQLLCSNRFLILCYVFMAENNF